MDYIKDAFQKVKQDIDLLKEEISSLRQLLQTTNKGLESLKKEFQQKLNNQNISNSDFNFPLNNSTNNLILPTDMGCVGTNPTDNLLFKAPKDENLTISTGNKGVPTNRQTDKQTDQHIEKSSFDNAFDIINSLDSIKKEIRNKFKHLTEQEFIVFSVLYQLNETKGPIEYKDLSSKLNLSESSIRDYIGKLIKKGIPIEKNKINNKIIKLSISENLKKLASLSVIVQLREL